MNGDDKKELSVEVTSCPDESGDEKEPTCNPSFFSGISESFGKFTESLISHRPPKFGKVCDVHTRDEVVNRIDEQHGKGSSQTVDILHKKYLKDFFEDLPTEYFYNSSIYPSEPLERVYRVRSANETARTLGGYKMLLDTIATGVNVFDGPDVVACNNLRSKLGFTNQGSVQESSCKSEKKA